MAGWLQLGSKRWWLSCRLIRKYFSPYDSVARLFLCSDRSMSAHCYPHFPHPASAPALRRKLFSFSSIFAFLQHRDCEATLERPWWAILLCSTQNTHWDNFQRPLSINPRTLECRKQKIKCTSKESHQVLIVHDRTFFCLFSLNRGCVTANTDMI